MLFTIFKIFNLNSLRLSADYAHRHFFTKNNTQQNTSLSRNIIITRTFTTRSQFSNHFMKVEKFVNFEKKVKKIVFDDNFMYLPSKGLHSQQAIYNKLLHIYVLYGRQGKSTNFSMNDIRLLVFRYYYSDLIVWLCIMYKNFFISLYSHFVKLWILINFFSSSFLIYTVVILPKIFNYFLFINVLLNKNYTFMMSLCHKMFWYCFFIYIIVLTMFYLVLCFSPFNYNNYPYITIKDRNNYFILCDTPKYRFNGYNDDGFDIWGFDRKGYDCHGFDIFGFDSSKHYNPKICEQRDKELLQKIENPVYYVNDRFYCLPLVDQIKLVLSCLPLIFIGLLIGYLLYFIIKALLLTYVPVLFSIYTRFYVLLKFYYYWNLGMFLFFSLGILSKSFLDKGFFLQLIYNMFFYPLFSFFSLILKIVDTILNFFKN